MSSVKLNIYQRNSAKISPGERFIPKPRPLPIVKESFIKKKLKHWKVIYDDYINVIQESCQYIRQKPVKCFKFAILTTALAYCASVNPDEKHFENHLLNCSAELGTIGPLVMNRHTAAHINYVKAQNTLKRLRRLNFLLFSIIYLEKTNQDCCKYDTHCKYLNMWPSEFKNRFIDIGFMNKWWILDKIMVDYDVNF